MYSVPVAKPNGNVRICGDYKLTVNQVSKLDNYPIPKTEDLLATLGGGEKLTKLDMSQAYQQMTLDEESRKFTTINTHKGLFQYNRLPFGVSSAPGIFLEDDGKPLARHSSGHCANGQHSHQREGRQQSHCKFRSSTQEAVRSWTAAAKRKVFLHGARHHLLWL